MTIFGKRLAEYVEFAKPFLALILAVGIGRLALSLGGVPNSTAKWVSITAVMWIGIWFYSIRDHTPGFGTYRQLHQNCSLHLSAPQVTLVVAPTRPLGTDDGQYN